MIIYKPNLEDYKLLAKCGCKYVNDLPENWVQIDSYENKKSGFRGKLFENKILNEIVVSFGPTDVYGINTDLFDITNDLNMVLEKFPPQIINARLFYQHCKETYPAKRIVVTGYSLGGSLAEIIGYETGAITITFNAFGVNQFVKTNKLCDNILNIGNTKDFIFMSNLNNHLGQITISPNESGNILMPKFILGSQNHNIDNLSLANLIDYEKNSIKSFYDKMETNEAHQVFNMFRKLTKGIFNIWDKLKNNNDRDSSYSLRMTKYICPIIN